LSSGVYVAGAGALSAIGHSYATSFLALKNSTHGIGPLSSLSSIYKSTLPVGEVKLSNEQLAAQAGLTKPVTRTALLGIHAAREAITDSKLDITKWRTGLVSATTVGGMDRTEVFFPDFLKDNTQGILSDVIHHGCGATTDLIAQALGITDFTTTINTACSSSANAIMLGARLIRQNKLDVVIAGGTDSLTRFTVNGFKSLMILSDELCQPFDASRKGLNLGEGAGFVVLVSSRVLQEENLKVKAILTGFANTNDAYHQTASSPDGRGSFAAMQNALTMAGLATSEIDYINLHGTGTLNNDLSEGTAIARLFAEKIPAMSSTKSFTGHTLGACGGLEAVFSVMAIEHQCVFANLRFETTMPEVNLSPQTKFEHKAVNHVMSNSFGFGGNCSSLIFSRSSVG
jgi:3-oxoacyl-(acyl-carrier-protein) synthase